jgi:aminopeptidase YwaD
MTNKPSTFVIILALTTSLLATPTSTTAAEISLEQVTKDINVLASNTMKGRANFSPEIEQAADYINQRFSQLGLSPLAGAKSFKQTFSIIQITPDNIRININGHDIAAEKIAIASTIKSLSWQKTDDFSTTIIGVDDKVSVIGVLNQQGGNHLVLVNNQHAQQFNRYQGYFQRGITKLSADHQGAIIVVLTDDTAIESVNINATTRIETKSITNMVGILPGKSKAEEIVLYSAHYDHLGAKSEGEGDLIYNGADDDASGTAAVINLAEHFAEKGNNARTLMFTTFAAEEIGGFGSRYFSKQLNPDHVVAMINIEMIGKASKFGEGALWMTGMERSNLGTLLNANLATTGAEIYADPYPKFNLFYRSDNATLARLGVPAHSFSSTQIDQDEHYHKVSDEVSSLNLPSMFKVIEALAKATTGLVDGTDSPTRVDTSRVKVRSTGKIY